MDKKIKEIIENEMDCLITDVDFVIKKEGSLQALVNMLEVAINYTRCCTELKDKEEQAFQEWITTQGYARRMHGYCLRGTENVHITDLRKYYRTLKNL